MEARTARDYGMPMSAWDAADENDRDWALALAKKDAGRCPICGGDDPDRLCQNPEYQHAWEVTTGRCYKQRAVLMTMERFKNDPYVSTVVPSVSLNPAKAKSARK